MGAHFPLLKIMAVAIFTATAAIALSTPASACLWEFGTAADGSVKIVEGHGGHGGRFHSSEPPGGWERKLKAYEQAADFSTNLEIRNDYAVALIRLGRPAEAIPMLETIERASPGKYVTAVNLGTAYELLGKDELALKWIVEGVKRNPQSHAGTEWLHVRILEAKLAQKKNPGWLREHAVFDGGPALTGNEPAPKMRFAPVKDHTGHERNTGDIVQALQYQLTERLQFVKPPEALVGELLLELGSLTALQANVEKAMPVMKTAGEFGPARAELHAKRTQHFTDLVRANPQSGKSTHDSSGANYFLLIVVGIPLLAVVYLVARRIRRKRAAGG